MVGYPESSCGFLNRCRSKANIICLCRCDVSDAFVFWLVTFQCIISDINYPNKLNCLLEISLKMERNNVFFRCIMLFYFRKGKNATQIRKKICVVYGEDAVSDRMCQKWFAKFHSREMKMLLALADQSPPMSTKLQL